MKKIFAAAAGIAVLVSLSAINTGEACTSFVLKAKDGSPVYGRSMEWGLSDLKSDIVMVPRNYSNVSKLDNGMDGMKWKNRYGFIAINAAHLSYYAEGMNETGLTAGALYFPGFAKFQEIEPGKEASTINAPELIGYILGQFKTVGEVREALPKILVVDNKDIAKAFGAPAIFHFVVTDSAGDSIVIEYVKGKLNIYDSVGIMTNSPPYYWHVMNLRNYAHLNPFEPGPAEMKDANSVNLASFGAGAGMVGLPGDNTPPSRFVRAFFYVKTSIPLDDADAAVNQAARILDNFDYPKGIVREGESPEKYFLNFTTWFVIGDIRNRHYYWWTEFNRQLRMIDLTKLNFGGKELISVPLDKVRAQNIDNRTGDFIK